MCRSTQLDKHYVLVGEPGTYNLTHLCPINGKGHTLGQEIFEFISETVLCKKLTIIGTDEQHRLSKFNGTICFVKKLLKNPLQRSTFLLYTNESPFDMSL